MCGRFAQVTDSKKLTELFSLISNAAGSPRYNIAPTQPIVVIRHTLSGRTAQHMRWGLVPPWAPDLHNGAKLINARAETVFQKASFSVAARHQRCIIPADAFYEWQKTENQRIPTLFRPTTNVPFFFAGLWSPWANNEGDLVYTATILTTAANDTMQPFHHRMPVILGRADADIWLEHTVTTPDRLLPLLKQAPNDAIRSQPISTRVNSVRNDDLACWSAPESPRG